jgi:hypothetical protein
VLVLGLVAGLAGSAGAHLGVDADRAQAALVAVARYHAGARAAGPAGAEALFALGEEVEALVEAMNHDVRAHGEVSLFAQALLRRLEAYGVRVATAGATRVHAYDLAAFEEYLRRAPSGPHAADAQFKLLARRFHGSVGHDPGRLADGDVSALLGTIAAAERFLREHGGHGRAADVRFFLAVDYYRAARHLPDPARAREYAGRARRALEAVAASVPGTAEARAASTLLEMLPMVPPAR